MRDDEPNYITITAEPVDFGSPEVIEAQYSFIECLECKTTLVEDGEVVHEDLE